MTTTLVVEEIPGALIHPDPTQPRKTFDAEALERLARSIDATGLQHPIRVTRRPDGEYQIVEGERRWRAIHGILGRPTVPAIVMDDDAVKAKQVQILENLVREQLNPIEEARAYKQLMDLGWTLDDIWGTTGMRPAQVSWRVQMLKARDDVLHLVERGQLKPSVAHEISKLSTVGQAKAVRLIQDQRLTYQECIWACERILADECQGAMPLEEIEEQTPKEARTQRTFERVFAEVGQLLTRLQSFIVEDDTQGLVKALGPAGGVAEARVTEMMKGLKRLRRQLHRGRVQKWVS